MNKVSSVLMDYQKRGGEGRGGERRGGEGRRVGDVFLQHFN